MDPAQPDAAAAAAADHATDRSGVCAAHAAVEASWDAGVRDPRRRERGQGEKGCSHYRRRCKIVSPCCDEVFWCRHCHNQVHAEDEPEVEKQHTLERRKVQEVVCAMCDVRQKIADHCCACGVAFGAYVCLECSFFDDDLDKRQFHCGACGICRVGGRDNFFHCSRCGCCYAKSLQDNHVCIEDSMKQNCPVCFEFLFDSVRPTAVLPCGHTIHSQCLKDLTKARTSTCPICMKSYGDMARVWERLDEEVATTPMPLEYRNWQVELLCNDCQKSSRVRFHFVGQKCPAEACGSYNTRRVTILRFPHDAEPDSVPALPEAAPPAEAPPAE
jgi:RING finger/CHY zinc finger protein 1